MATIKDVCSELGWTEDQLRYRLRQLRSILNGSIRIGYRGSIELSPEAVELLRRLRQLESAGVPLGEAVAKLIQDSTTAPQGSEDFRTKLVRGFAQRDPWLRLAWVLTGILGIAVVGFLTLGILALIR